MIGLGLDVTNGVFSGLEKYIMSRRFTRLLPLSVLVLTSNVWAIGLGDINLESALNEPLRAEIVLLSASADELAELKVMLASAETFARYGIDRPIYLQDVDFEVINGGVGRSIVRLRSRSPITEPFLTFLVEATWSSGRLLREYTVLLDPPTYAPPALQQVPAVTAPARSVPDDSGRIERQSTPAPRAAQPAAAASTDPAPNPLPPVDDTPYATTNGSDIVVQRGDTLWGLASRLRPDSRLTMNQTMLAIYEANRDAFGGNINLLEAGASLRVPSADEVFQISRGDALREVQRQHSTWGGSSGYIAPEATTQPGLTLVPPDEEPVDSDYDDTSIYNPPAREQEVEGRIAELEAADVSDQQSLIEIRDNELAALRQELADIRGEVYEPPVDDTFVDEDVVGDADELAGIDDLISDTDEQQIFAEDTDVDDTVPGDAGISEDATDTVAEPPAVIRTSSAGDDSIVDQAIKFLTGAWGIILGAVLLVVAGLFWFMRRGDDDDDDTGPWVTLDSEESAVGAISATATMQVPTHEEAIVVVEQDSGVHPILEDTVETPSTDVAAGQGEASGSFGSLEDTFSSETAVNLDQSDPIAEADFHMAYGLYDQAADLINGALETEPSDRSLMSKLCEIYFVWGNRDSFVDAATRLKASIGDGADSSWDKIVIMGQQIAADHQLFAGAALIGAAKDVDLSFEDAGDQAGDLDMDFGAEGGDADDVIDLGADADIATAAVDFDFDVTAEAPTLDSSVTEATAEMPVAETPTIEEQFLGFEGGTSELPTLDESLHQAISDSGQDADATAEINLDELDLGGIGMEETEIASLGDLDATGQNEALSDTGLNEAIFDPVDVTGKNPKIDPSATGVAEKLDLSDPDSSGMRLAADETGQNPMASAEVDIDASLLEATGVTQVLSEDLAADIAGDFSDTDATLLAPGLTDDAETMLASLDGDEFDFAKTEALPPEAFSGDAGTSAETLAIAATDVDLDLDDLTAALQVSEIGDTVEQPRDDATVEQPRPTLADETAEVPTMSLAPEDMSSDLHDARTMTEVGTKLDLARAYVDMGDPAGARSILEEVLDEGDEGQKQQAQQLLDSLPG